LEASKKREAAYAKVLTPMASAEAQNKANKADKTVIQAKKDASTPKPKKEESTKKEETAKKEDAEKKDSKVKKDS